ncbi:MAG TPA: Gfo/Idh/MocA family oxidoreductase [Thermoanaerobaculia bacterium]|nr:Gfo/Idh/MocA family oxidoreductase [Thermoanaerobaculia bacterium]
MRILVTGATGFIGSEVVSAALAAGHEVRSLARRDWTGPPHVPLRHRFFGRLPLDLPAECLEGADAVVHCAAVSDPSERRSHAVNVVGTLALARAAQEAGTRTLVFLSSQSARPDSASPYGKSKHEAERQLLLLQGLEVVVLRPGLVCGLGGLFGRMVGLVRGLPAVPVLAGGSIVQPVLVDDLVRAILGCLEESRVLAGKVYCIGEEEGTTLRRMLGLIGNEVAPRGKLLLSVPTAPLSMAVRAAEVLRIPLPINSANLTGARSAQRMDTARDMERLGVPRRTAAEIVHLALARRSREAEATSGVGAAKTLLIGAGRIGLVHAVTLSRLPGMVLSGTVDTNPGARRLMLSMGVRTNCYSTLEEAVRSGGFDAAVIATPPASHLELARASLERGLRTLIEKPACAGEPQLPTFEALGEQAGDRALVGYLMVRVPHVSTWLSRLHRGELGTVRGFAGLTLLSLIGKSSPDRWETRKQSSSGGVLANSSSHVLSAIYEAFGPPLRVVVQTRRLFSREVEDSAVIRFEYDGFSGVHYSSWSIEGFQRQENRLVVWTDRGRLTLTLSTGLFERADGEIELTHQLEDEVGFNLAPDYAGGGIAAELRDLGANHPPAADGPAMTLSRALGIEKLLFSVYAAAQEVDRFDPGLAAGGAPAEEAPAHPPWQFVEPKQERRICDLREVEPERLAELDLAGGGWDGALVYTDGFAPSARRVDGRHLRVTVPNFLRQTRWINEKRYLDVLRSFGLRGAVRAALVATPPVARERGVGFWAAAGALLAGDLARIPASFTGTLLLHPYLADLALALDRLDRLEALIGILRRQRPRARVGFHSNLWRDALNAAALLEITPDALSLLASPTGRTLARARAALELDPALSGIELTAEVGPAPLEVHRLAFADPRRWMAGADAVLIGALADDRLFAAVKRDMAEHWESAFAGMAPPAVLW